MRKTLIYLFLIIILAACTRNIGKERANIYYFDTLKNSMVVEEVFLEEKENELIIPEIIQHFYTIVNNVPQLRIPYLPIDITLENGTITVNFNREYHNLTTQEQMMLRSSLTYTLTDIDFVKQVYLLVDGLPITNSKGAVIGAINDDNIIISAVNPNPSTNYTTLKLYFKEEGSMLLAMEEREIQVNKDIPLEKYIIEELVKGPQQEGLYADMLPNSIVNYIETKEGVCQVDFSNSSNFKEILKIDTEQLFIYSIVNSLTELSHIQKVGFLVDGKKNDNTLGNVDLNLLFERNESLIAK
ncbi:MAG: hypothetical protein BEN19_00010 [Epulopiscium sp. Nuni2H_MBin003]|nr:MAG: hypothetical protein BEN19_00010 [Epulopiscium sp. Nuni2H_MBin003]